MADSSDTSYLSINSCKQAEDLTRKLTSLKMTRGAKERTWKQNLAFYRGRQYTYINRVTRRLETLPVEDGDKPRHIIRLVANAIMPNVHSLLARLTKTKPEMECVPGSGDDQALKAAQMADQLLEYLWDDLMLDDKLEEALLWSLVASQGYWKVSWDKQAGKPMQFLLGPDGQPVIDESLKSIYLTELQKQGVQPQQMTKTVYVGDINVQVLSPFEVFLDPSAYTFSECKWAICQHPMDPDEIKARWGKNLDVAPDNAPSQMDAVSAVSSGTSTGSDQSDRNSTKLVNFLYQLPSPLNPKGRYCVWIDRPNKILEDTEWPYPFRHLPIVKFGGIRIPGEVYDTSVVEQAVPLQKEYNRTLSQIVEFKNLTIRPQLIAPAGALRQRLTNEPGAVWEYMPIAGLKPEPLNLGNLPAYVFEHAAQIKQRIDETFFQNEISQGSVPPNVEAGIAIDLLQEMATDRLAPIIKLMEKSLESAGNMMLCLAQQYYGEPRLLKIKGSGGSVQVKQFTKADIAGNITVNVETGSGLPRTRAGRQAQILELIRLGVIAPDNAYKYLELGDMKALGAQMAANEDQALREHEKILNGIPTNPIDLQQAEEALQQGGGQMNPETGQPFQSPEEMQDWLQGKAFGPTPFEDFRTHLDTHALFMKSAEFDGLPVQVQELFYTHFNSTLSTLMNLPQLPKDTKAPNVTLQLKGTVGPTGAADILNKTGVTKITPETMQEPPLETWVNDPADKDPNFTAGNNPLSMEHMQAQMEALQKQQQMEQAAQQQAQQLAQGQQAHEQKMVHQSTSHLQQTQQADEAHQMRMKNAAKPKKNNS